MRLVREEPTADVHAQLADARRESAALRQRATDLGESLSRIDAELRIAGRLQRDFLPRSLPRVGPARFATLFRPAGHVSGDCYDAFPIGPDHVGFYVADAVGHGVPAALLTMFVRHAIVAHRADLTSPGRTLAHLNAAMLAQNLSADTFATAAYGVLHVPARTVTMARAGHPHPVVLSADGPPAPVACDGTLLGIVPDATYAEATVHLPPAVRLLLHTDGVEVAFAADPADSISRWQLILADHGRTTPGLLASVAAALADRGPPPDDLTLLALDLD